MFSYLDHLECTQCGKTFPHTQLVKISPCCGKVLFARYDLPRMRREVDRNSWQDRVTTMWRFSELMPVEDPDNVITLGEGATPFWAVKRERGDVFRGVFFQNYVLVFRHSVPPRHSRL